MINSKGKGNIIIGEEELEVSLCDFIYQGNVECLLFSYFLLGNEYDAFGDHKHDLFCCNQKSPSCRKFVRGCRSWGDISESNYDYFENID